MTSIDQMPNFFIIGAAKAGTTTLYELLRQHPDVFLSVIKEPQFFCHEEEYRKGMRYYLSTYFRDSERYSARGESTPHYIYFDKVARRISRDIPAINQKFIVLLRDPVKRAYSLYWNMVAEGVEDLGFAEAIDREEERSLDPALAENCTLRYQYFKSGKYAEQIENYQRYFSPHKFLYILFEDLSSDPIAVAKRIFRFLGVNDSFAVSCNKVFNPSGVPRFRCIHEFVRAPFRLKSKMASLLPKTFRYLITSKIIEHNMKTQPYEPMHHELEKHLRQAYRADILRLEHFTGRDLSGWLNGK